MTDNSTDLFGENEEDAVTKRRRSLFDDDESQQAYHSPSLSEKPRSNRSKASLFADEEEEAVNAEQNCEENHDPNKLRGHTAVLVENKVRFATCHNSALLCLNNYLSLSFRY